MLLIHDWELHLVADRQGACTMHRQTVIVRDADSLWAYTKELNDVFASRPSSSQLYMGALNDPGVTICKFRPEIICMTSSVITRGNA